MMENELQPRSWGGDLFGMVTFERRLNNGRGDSPVEVWGKKSSRWRKQCV